MGDATRLTRRAFLRGVAGVTAAGVLLPSEAVVRRFWRLDRTMLAAAEAQPPWLMANQTYWIDVRVQRDDGSWTPWVLVGHEAPTYDVTVYDHRGHQVWVERGVQSDSIRLG